MRTPPSPACARLGVGVAVLLAGVSLAGTASAKPFEEYIQPTPEVAPLSSATWGVAGVIPRDISNGIESAMGAGVHPQWYYWDGEIIPATDGKYHMFMSTFDANTNFGTGWKNSDAFHAISQTNVLGPYVRQDYVYTNNGSHKGHNVSAAQLSDGSYVVVVSEIVPFQLYKSSSLDGPWTGCSPQERYRCVQHQLRRAPRRQIRNHGAQRGHRDRGHPVWPLREAEADVRVYQQAQIRPAPSTRSGPRYRAYPIQPTLGKRIPTFGAAEGPTTSSIRVPEIGSAGTCIRPTASPLEG